MRFESHVLPPAAGFPNNPKLPLLLYRKAAPLDAAAPSATFEQLFTGNGWVGAWRNGDPPLES